MDHIREGKHGAASTKQAIAIGLSKARRSGVKLPPPKKGKTSAATRTKAERDVKKGQSSAKKKTSAKRSRAVSAALKREGHWQPHATHCPNRRRPRLASADRHRASNLLRKPSAPRER